MTRVNFNINRMIKFIAMIIITVGLMSIFSGCNIRDLIVGQGDRNTQFNNLADLNPNNIKSAIINVIEWGAGAAGSTAALFFIYGGFQYMLAFGNDEKMEKAKSTISFAVVGMAVIILAYLFVFLLLERIIQPDIVNNIKNP